jgi:hypothetical protein
MLSKVTRSRVIQVWFVAVVLMIVAAVAVGVEMTAGTAALLLTLSLVPPAIVLALWPGSQPLTAAQILHGGDSHE